MPPRKAKGTGDGPAKSPTKSSPPTGTESSGLGEFFQLAETDVQDVPNVEVPTSIRPKRSLFDHLDAIYSGKLTYFDDLSDDERKTYSSFMVNRFISMEPDYIEVVNALQQFYSAIGSREHFLFYSQLGLELRWNKYVKPKKEIPYEDWLVGLVSDHFEIGRSETEACLDLYMATADGKMALKTLLEAYGTDPKLIRKLKLTQEHT